MSVMIPTADQHYGLCLHMAKPVYLNTIKELSQAGNSRAGIKGCGQAGCLLSLWKGKSASLCSGLYHSTLMKHCHLSCSLIFIEK